MLAFCILHLLVCVCVRSQRKDEIVTHEGALVAPVFNTRFRHLVTASRDGTVKVCACVHVCVCVCVCVLLLSWGGGGRVALQTVLLVLQLASAYSWPYCCTRKPVGLPHFLISFRDVRVCCLPR